MFSTPRSSIHAQPFLVLLTLLFAISFLGETPLRSLERTASAATTFIVNSTADAPDNSPGDGICNDGTGACTLRAAMQESNNLFGEDTITFSLPGASTITLNTALPEITDNLTITGPGSSQLTVRRNTAGGTPLFRIFFNNNRVTTISGLTISNGRTAPGVDAATNGGQGGNGGGILTAGSLTLTDVVVTGNFTGNGGNATNPGSTFGGPAGFGGGISSSGSLILTNVTVSNNTTGIGGNGGFGHTGGRGGGIFATGTLTMTQCIVSGNNTGIGGVGSNAGASGGNGGDGAGIYADTGTVNLTNVNVSGNNSGDGAGESGTGGHGGGIFLVSTTTRLNNTNVTNNTTGDGSAGFVGQGGLGGGI
jgi:CSLREA domain-containing protein